MGYGRQLWLVSAAAYCSRRELAWGTNLRSPVAIDWSALRQEVDGFGASEAWYSPKVVEKLPAAELTRLIRVLYDPQEGAGLSLLRVRIDPRTFQADTKQHDWASTNLQRQAAFVKAVQDAYQPVTLATPWTPPAWMKDSNALKNGGRLKAEHYGDYARCLADWVAGMREKFGVRVDVLSAQNEPGKKAWESCEWSQAEFVRFFVQHLAPAMREPKLTTRLLAAEWTGWETNGSMRSSRTQPARRRSMLPGRTRTGMASRGSVRSRRFALPARSCG